MTKMCLDTFFDDFRGQQVYIWCSYVKLFCTCKECWYVVYCWYKILVLEETQKSKTECQNLKVSIFNSTEFTAIWNLRKIVRSQKNAQNHTTVGLFKCIYCGHYWRYQPEMLHTFLRTFGDHFLKISSDSEVVMLESSEKFVELTRKDPILDLLWRRHIASWRCILCS